MEENSQRAQKDPMQILRDLSQTLNTLKIVDQNLYEYQRRIFFRIKSCLFIEENGKILNLLSLRFFIHDIYPNILKSYHQN